jgi:hypothetical protein
MVAETSGDGNAAAPRYVRAPLWARLLGIFGAAANLVPVAVFLARVPAWGLGAIPLALVFVAPAYLMSRAAVMHVRIDADGLSVRNPIHTYDVSWAEIEDISVVNQFLGIGSYAQILRVDARPVTLAISNFGARGSSASADRVAEPLKEALNQARLRSPMSGRTKPAVPLERSAGHSGTRAGAPTGHGDATA